MGEYFCILNLTSWTGWKTTERKIGIDAMYQFVRAISEEVLTTRFMLR